MIATLNKSVAIRPSSRILQVGKYYPPYFGGMESHLYHLCRNLQGLVDIEVVVANHGKEKRTTAINWIDEVKVTRAGTLCNVAATPICPEMVRLIRHSGADIVHLHHPNPMAVLAYLASGHQGKLILSYHSDIVRQKMLGTVFQPILNRVLEKCAAIIVASPNYLQSSLTLAPYRDKCLVIPYGIPVANYRTPDRSVVATIRECYGSRLIMAVGRMVYYKGFEYLVQAMKNIQGHLLLVGDGPLKESLEREAQLAGVRDRITFLGPVSDEDLVNYYHAVDVFALPSILRSEAFGIVQLEAMACGKPVVNTQLDSGVPFASLHEETGFTVPPRNPLALADAINKLLDDPVLRGGYGAAAQRRVEREFSEEIMTRRTLQLYAKVAEKTALQRFAVAVETVGS